MSQQVAGFGTENLNFRESASREFSISLFDKLERSDERPKHDDELTFAYYNRSAQAAIGTIRNVMEMWFAEVPVGSQPDLRSRFRSPLSEQHQGAFLELLIRELLRGMGFGLIARPPLTGVSSSPAFLATTNGQPNFYLETTLAGLPPTVEADGNARMEEVLALTNRINVSNVYLEIECRGGLATGTPTREFWIELQTWVDALDINRIYKLCRSGRFQELPSFSWKGNGSWLWFRPIPKSWPLRPTADPRSKGIRMGDAITPLLHRDIRNAIEAKASCAGTLSAPLVVAVSVVSDGPCGVEDILNGLFGTDDWAFPDCANGRFVRPTHRPGAWVGKYEPRNRAVSAVLITHDLDMFPFEGGWPLLIHNPFAEHRLNPACMPVRQMIPNTLTRRMEERPGVKVNNLLRVTDPWPPVELEYRTTQLSADPGCQTKASLAHTRRCRTAWA